MVCVYYIEIDDVLSTSLARRAILLAKPLFSIAKELERFEGVWV